MIEEHGGRFPDHVTLRRHVLLFVFIPCAACQGLTDNIFFS